MAGVLLISLLVCMYCCCRRKKKVTKFAHETARKEREREERRIKAEERYENCYVMSSSSLLCQMQFVSAHMVMDGNKSFHSRLHLP